MRFSLSEKPIDPIPLRAEMLSLSAGGYCSFEGWVRNHHLGRTVLRLEYEAYGPLALKQGQAVLIEARQRFAIEEAMAIHRTGPLDPGQLAIWIGVTAAHRDAAFAACRFIIDTIKETVPIWKHEFYADGTDVWVDPTDCSCAHSHAK